MLLQIIFLERYKNNFTVICNSAIRKTFMLTNKHKYVAENWKFENQAVSKQNK